MHLAFAVLLCALLVRPAVAHFPEGIVFKAFQFPDDQIPAMDGDLTDWDIVPPEYILEEYYLKSPKQVADSVHCWGG